MPWEWVCLYISTLQSNYAISKRKGIGNLGVISGGVLFLEGAKSWFKVPEPWDEEGRS